MDENILDEEVNEEKNIEEQVESEELDNTQEPEVQENEISSQIDYYDYYYDRVLNNLNTISTNSNTLIQNQEIIIDKLDVGLSFFKSIFFLISLWFVLNSMRKMIGER